MPRTSLKEIRSEEILTAFADCIVRFGLNGATQDRIAEAAGVKRTILRHYLGNRDDMIQALLNHVAQQFMADTNELIASLPNEDRVCALLKLLFDYEYAQQDNYALVIQALTNVSEQYPEINEKLMKIVDYFVEVLTRELQQAYPIAQENDLFEVAIGIMGIYFSIDSLVPLDVPTKWWSASERAAHRLVNSLKEK